MKIGIPLSQNAYTPEAYAYSEYLAQRGWEVQLDYDLDPDNDINIYFMGIRPFYKKRFGKAKIIHEYQSLSTAPLAKVKDLAKRFMNEKPDGRIFLNSKVSDVYSFNDDLPFIYRDMGVSDIYFQTPSSSPIYDVVYCGSIANRYGIESAFMNVIKKGLKLVVIGDATKEFKEKFKLYSNIEFLGRLKSEDIAKVYYNSKFGLNFTPDIYPFNIQTSTKTLEYLASGLKLITNKYVWIDDFCHSINYNPIYIEDLLGENNRLFCDNNNDFCGVVDKYRWNFILEKSNFDIFLNSLKWVY